MDAFRAALKEKGWEKKWLWSFGHDGSADALEREHACLTYILREMSRGRVPDPHLIESVLLKKKDVPQCGYINCKWDAPDHVH